MQYAVSAWWFFFTSASINIQRVHSDPYFNSVSINIKRVHGDPYFNSASININRVHGGPCFYQCVNKYRESAW